MPDDFVFWVRVPTLVGFYSPKCPTEVGTLTPVGGAAANPASENSSRYALMRARMPALHTRAVSIGTAFGAFAFGEDLLSADEVR